MGAVCGKASATKEDDVPQQQSKREKSSKPIKKPVWQSQGMTHEELDEKRAEFWDTQPAYGGSPEIWAAIKTACEAPDMETTNLYLEAAEVKVAKPDLTAFYDSRGFLYEIPQWAVSDPADF